MAEATEITKHMDEFMTAIKNQKVVDSDRVLDFVLDLRGMLKEEANDQPVAV